MIKCSELKLKGVLLFETEIYEDSRGSFSEVYKESDYFNIRFQYKPLMIWIWISALLMSCGGFIRVIQKRI